MGTKVQDARIRRSEVNATGCGYIFFKIIFPEDATLVMVNIFVRRFSKIDHVKMVSLYLHLHSAP